MDSLLLYNVDSVVSVYEDQDLHFQHAKYGLEALNPGAMNQLTLEREALYVDNSAIRVLWRDLLTSGSLFGQTLGHIVMPIERSYKIHDYTSRFIVEKLIEFSLKNTFEEGNS